MGSAAAAGLRITTHVLFNDFFDERYKRCAVTMGF